jgi:outer membrane protein TolC
MAITLLSGCAAFAPDGGFGTVSDLTRERTGQPATWQRTPDDADNTPARVAELLRQPLSADSSVEIALLNNAGLQARFAELGVAEAERVRAGRLANPRIGFGRMHGGGHTEIDRSVMFDILGLLTLPASSQLEQRRFERVQLQAAAEAVGVAHQARQAFFQAVAAEQLARYQAQVQEAADVSSELARRMQQAGNLSQLDRLREQAFTADTSAALSRSRQHALAAREHLVRTLGLPHASITLPERLPDLPPAPYQANEVEQTAMDRRLDVLMARRSLDATARSLGLTKATRFVNVLELGYANKSSTGAARENGYELELELPLFDFGSTRAARAEALYMRSLHQAADAAVTARSEAREAYALYHSAYQLARHYQDEVIPLRKRISDETLLRYNGMLIGVFELLADAREQIGSVTASIEALRDHWLADTRLQAAMAMPPDKAATAPVVPPTEATHPPRSPQHTAESHP